MKNKATQLYPAMWDTIAYSVPMNIEEARADEASREGYCYHHELQWRFLQVANGGGGTRGHFQWVHLEWGSRNIPPKGTETAFKVVSIM